jgi:DNA uptake protein ComE-like DNA-binding protein
MVTAAADGQINIRKPEPDAFGNEPSTGITPQPVVKINTMSERELIEHRDIGSLHAKEVMANRPYVGIDDFKARSGLPPETVDRLKDTLDF